LEINFQLSGWPRGVREFREDKEDKTKSGSDWSWLKTPPSLASTPIRNFVLSGRAARSWGRLGEAGANAPKSNSTVPLPKIDLKFPQRGDKVWIVSP
jgi:hypothetical protein